MRMSEAIRLGAMMHEQCFNTECMYGLDGQSDKAVVVVATCAMGAAVQAGFKYSEDDPIQQRPIFLCPVCPTLKRFHMSTVIVCLNDNHRWTRERIADWVEAAETAFELAVHTEGQVSTAVAIPALA